MQTEQDLPKLEAEANRLGEEGRFNDALGLLQRGEAMRGEIKSLENKAFQVSPAPHPPPAAPLPAVYFLPEVRPLTRRLARAAGRPDRAGLGRPQAHDRL